MASKPSASGRSRPQSDAMSQWIVGSKIGKGSFASVYVGHHKVSASPVCCSLRSCLRIKSDSASCFVGSWALGHCLALRAVPIVHKDSTTGRAETD